MDEPWYQPWWCAAGLYDACHDEHKEIVEVRWTDSRPQFRLEGESTWRWANDDLNIKVCSG